MYNPVGVVVTWFRVGAWRFRAVGAVAPVVLCTSKRPQEGGLLASICCFQGAKNTRFKS